MEFKQHEITHCFFVPFISRPAWQSVKELTLPSFITPNWNGEPVEDDPRRFGFYSLRHSLASLLVRTKTDPKTVKALLRHSDVRTTLQLYAHSVTEDRMAAQELALLAILGNGKELAAPANC